MWDKSNPSPIRLHTVFYLLAILLALANITPVLAEYVGPNRTVTETVRTCRVVLNQCMLVSAKNSYSYKSVADWACGNESKPWKAYPSSGPRCNAANVDARFWSKEESVHEVDTTYPPATIDSILQNCTLNNGWCTTPPFLNLSAEEPIAGYTITSIEGTLNGLNFACLESECSVPLTEGDNALTYWALSSWGDGSTMGSISAKVDSQQPAISGTLSGTAGSNGWFISPVTYNGSASDATSGLASFTCTLDGITPGSCNSISVSSEGPHTLVLSALDNAGNTSLLTQDLSIDSKNPALNSALQGTLGSNNWYNAAQLQASASDPAPGSGLSTIEYKVDGTDWAVFPASGVLDLPDGQHTVELRAVDVAGNSTSSSKSFSLDSVSPEIILNPQGTLGSNTWYVTSVNLEASASDGTSGLDLFEYSLNSGSWKIYAAPLLLNDGSYNISFWAQDKSGLVTQVDRVYQVDTVRPQIAGSLSGTPGANGWYVSDVVLSASAADPLPGSGVDAFTYILDGGVEAPYTNALTISEGLHTIRLNVQDQAGLTYFTEQSIKVDTVRPSLTIQTSLPAWIKDKVTLTGSSADTGSGLSRVEISTDGGQSWKTAAGTTSWSYEWDTFSDSNGVHNVIVRAVDQAGLTTEQVITSAVDNQKPSIVLPKSWLQWQTITLDVWDDGSGLSLTRVEISDPTGRYPKRTIQLDHAEFPLSFNWDRRFGDNSIAPNGTYDLVVTAVDQLGNVATQYASVQVLLDILPAGPTATQQPYYRATPTPVFTLTPLPTSLPTATSTSVVSLFGEIQPTAQATEMPLISQTPRTAPTQTSVLDWLESVLIPRTDLMDQTAELNNLAANSTDSAFPGTQSSVLWGAAAAAVVGAATGYTIEERRKKTQKRQSPIVVQTPVAKPKPQNTKEAEAALESRKAKARAQRMKKLEKQWQQEKEWEQARLQEQFIADSFDASMKGKLAKREMEDQIDWAKLQAATIAKAEQQRHVDKLTRDEEKQARLDTYVERQPETVVPESNWWEKTKSFVQDNILDPWNQYVYEPIIEPAQEKRNEILKNTASWLNSNFYQPYIAPGLENSRNQFKNEFSWINNTIVQPWIIPFGKEVVGVISDGMSLLNTYVVEPYVAPAISKAVEWTMEGVAKFNENVFQPKILPALEKFNENFYQPYLSPLVDMAAEGVTDFVDVVTERIYEPVFAPVVNDISKYIVKPYVDPAVEWWDKTWDEYGEWVHNSLDAVGFIPGLGDMMDAVNGLIYLAEGRYLEASISMVAMIPVLGDLAKAGKLGLKVTTELVEEAAEKVVKEVAEEAAELAAKETAEEITEQAGKELAENLAQKTAAETAEELAENVVEKATTETAKELTEKAAKETLENTAAKLANETAETLAPKTLKDSVTNASENLVQKTTDDIAEKAAKNAGEASASAATEKAAKEAKQQLVEQALEKVDDKTAELVRSVAEKLGDDVASISQAVAFVQKYGDNAVKTLKAVEPEAAAKVLRSVDGNVLDDVVQQGPDAFAAFSGWAEQELKEHGKDLAARAAKDAEVLSDVKTLISKGPIDPKNLTDEQRLLIEKIAANSTFNSDVQKVVVGKWVGLDGGFLARAKETGSLHYSPHPDLWNTLEQLGADNQDKVAWLVNQQVIKTGIGKGLNFEYTLDGIPLSDINKEKEAIDLIFSGKTDEKLIRRTLGIKPSQNIPFRIRELLELQNGGVKAAWDSLSETYILKL